MAGNLSPASRPSRARFYSSSLDEPHGGHGWRASADGDGRKTPLVAKLARHLSPLGPFNPEGKPNQVIVVLTNPRLDGKNILFNARTLKGEIPAQGGESALFIDGYQTPCNSGLDTP